MTEFTKIVEEWYELPKTRTALLDNLKALLDSGGVQKITIEHNKGIEVKRAVEFSGAHANLKESAELFYSSRNAEVEPLDYLAGKEPLRVLSRAFSEVTQRNFVPRAILVSDAKQFFHKWLNDKDHIYVEGKSMLFGVPVLVFGEIPEDAALLVGTAFDDSMTVRFSTKFFLE